MTRKKDSVSDNIQDGGAEMGPEATELWERLQASGAKHFHADWTAEGRALPSEEKAAAINRVFRHLDVRENAVAARISGEAMLIRDEGEHTLERFDCRTMSKVEPTRAERVRAESKIRLADLMEEAAELLRKHAPDKDTPHG